MLNKTYLLACIILVMSCTSEEKREKEQLTAFLTKWSTALQNKDESIRRFYDARFVFPKVVFEEVEGLQYSFSVADMSMLPHEDDENIYVRVPFEITTTESAPERGTIELTLSKSDNGYLILDMTQEFALQIKQHTMKLEASKHPEVTLQYDSIMQGILSLTKALNEQYDSVVFMTKVDDQTLFYVVNGSWENPYWVRGKAKEQQNSGNYKIGVVTAENKVIIPVEYTKVYNPNGSFKGMIEVENNGVRGLFHITGGAFIPAEFNGLYPTHAPGAIAQVKKGDAYGWVDTNGRVSFDPASHTEKKLFQSPIESNAILEWEFKFPGPIRLLFDPYEHPMDADGIIIYPSYVSDFGITKIANTWVDGGRGMGMYDTSVKFEKVETISEKFFGLIAFFMEAGADARDYHSIQNDLLVVDKDLHLADHLPSITDDSEYQDPCGEAASSCKSITPGLFESQNGHGIYTYHEIDADGKVHELKSNRQYNFTKFVLIDERYFSRCEYDNIPYDSDSKNGNLIVTEGVDLDVMRNEIFAEYGFKFKSPKWKAYFEAKPWYKPQHDNVDHLLTEKDKANIKFILDYQSLHKDVKLKRDTIFFGWAG